MTFSSGHPCKICGTKSKSPQAYCLAIKKCFGSGCKTADSEQINGAGEELAHYFVIVKPTEVVTNRNPMWLTMFYNWMFYSAIYACIETGFSIIYATTLLFFVYVAHVVVVAFNNNKRCGFCDWWNRSTFYCVTLIQFSIQLASFASLFLVISSPKVIDADLWLKKLRNEESEPKRNYFYSIAVRCGPTLWVNNTIKQHNSSSSST